MSATATDLDYRIAKLEMQRGDVLVFKTDIKLSPDQVAHVRECIKRTVPGILALIIDQGTEISVLTSAELRERLSV